MLHAAAQGDQPISIAAFLSFGLDVDSVDQNFSTPLHMAVNSGCEIAMNYLMI